jgi:hypothetical protein
MGSVRLYELGAEFSRLAELLEAGDESAELSAALEAVHDQLEQKAAGVGMVLASLDAEAESYTPEIERLTARRRSAQASAERLRKYVHTCLESRGILKLKGGTFEFRVQQNPESVVVTDESLVPDECKRSVTTTTVDKRAVLDAWRKHQEVAPGCAIQRTTRLVIK